MRNGGCGLLIRGSPPQLLLTERGGLVCRPISSHTYTANLQWGEGMENDSATNDYPIERYMSWEGGGQEKRRGMLGRMEVSDFTPVSAVR